MTDNLIQQLRDAGYDAAADSVRDTMIAKQLREAGRDDLAGDLEGKSEPTAPPKPRSTVPIRRQHENDPLSGLDSG